MYELVNISGNTHLFHLLLTIKKMSITIYGIYLIFLNYVNYSISQSFFLFFQIPYYQCRFFFLQIHVSLSQFAQEFLGDSQIGRYVILWDPLYNCRILFQEHLISVHGIS